MPPLDLTRDTVVRAYNLVAFANSSLQRQQLIPGETLITARAVLEIYDTPTPFKRKQQAGVTLPIAGVWPTPSARRPSFERNNELGFPVAWLAHSEGKRASERNVKREVDIFEQLTQDFCLLQEFMDWREAKGLEHRDTSPLGITTVTTVLASPIIVESSTIEPSLPPAN